jgi:hypothetical protein
MTYHILIKTVFQISSEIPEQPTPKLKQINTKQLSYMSSTVFSTGIVREVVTHVKRVGDGTAREYDHATKIPNLESTCRIVQRMLKGKTNEAKLER